MRKIPVIWGYKKSCTPISDNKSTTIISALMKQVNSFGYPYVLNIYET